MTEDLCWADIVKKRGLPLPHAPRVMISPWKGQATSISYFPQLNVTETKFQMTHLWVQGLPFSTKPPLWRDWIQWTKNKVLITLQVAYREEISHGERRVGRIRGYLSSPVLHSWSSDDTMKKWTTLTIPSSRAVAHRFFSREVVGHGGDLQGSLLKELKFKSKFASKLMEIFGRKQ